MCEKVWEYKQAEMTQCFSCLSMFAENKKKDEFGSEYYKVLFALYIAFSK